ncbi:MAG: D-alanyl-D-alanine carboxypeptidase [Rhizobiaceae bacterium]|nr:D-alanyl-D-alanine carboxypeptidase [Rhizobiaceae bacterium]MCV0405223.1 D-alanyl-D-alanine carboxypeptidase [Rhizobiaceae bacterium]
MANPKYAAIVVDANTGETLFARNADEMRYPASLTKMMTLYMTFEALTAGRISKSTRVTFSAQAAARPPTKIGVSAGGSITVEQAILSLVTKSANDAAAALGEMLAGSEASFARQMTAKARQLGMKSTTFRNASGLPDPEQRTTARDMAVLGLALREHYPEYYGYFSTRSFKFGKSVMRNHNRLLGSVKGVDGIKTGYIRASGFNLVSSVRDNGRSVVAVVMGGRTGKSRDAHMAELIRTWLPKASRRDNGPLVAKRVINSGSTVVAAGAVALPKAGAPVPAERPGEAVAVAYAAAPDPAPAVEAIAGAAAPAGDVTPQGDVDPLSTSSTRPSGWAIQVASLPSEPEAVAFLSKTTDKAAAILADASAFTEEFQHKGTTFYRARYGGFKSKDQAWATCGQLKKRSIACYAVQQ